MQGWLFSTYLCLGSLFALTGLRQIFIEPLDDLVLNLAWFGVQVLPLLVPLPGVLRGSIRATFLLCMVSLLYFIHGTMVVFEPELRVLGLVEAVFALGLCAATSFVVRKLREKAH